MPTERTRCSRIRDEAGRGSRVRSGQIPVHEAVVKNPNDPFKRSPSIMSYDRAKNRIVDQDARVWIAGLGDEGGSGSWLAAGMKLFGQPTKGRGRAA